MKRRRTLTEYELADANRLAVMIERDGRTQMELAHACGWKTQGAVHQYKSGLIPLNIPALLAFARVLRCDPATISPRLAAMLSTPPQALPPIERDRKVRETPSSYSIQPEKNWPLLAWPEILPFLAGELPMPDDARTYLECPLPFGDGFVVRVTDASMMPRFSPYYTQHVWARPIRANTSIADRSFVIALAPDESTQPILRRYAASTGTPLLQALADDWLPRAIPVKNNVQILAVACYHGCMLD